ncbi:DUF262 domain-containing protein [Flavobacterium sharifuzzamanii]|uniref:DUF262 domain-containing protein n=1 Tax=Flavobacterium sharifuzzamanii TaxID=2211133 RepID=UPI000DABDF54|nr:DUF262 domain-containing protein [Flavobacterium sharifuzzamanii]KAF2082096.1 DUF262 domain-containing protein [Flavobacterium sharifuzzamanii]
MEEIKTTLEKKTAALEVGTISLHDLFQNKLTIPDFQRPYEWDERLVLKLFKDIDEHFFLRDEVKDTSDFYLGSILLNKNGDDELQIVDGQQRLTTFLILDYLIDPENCFLNHTQFIFHSTISVKNITAIKNIIKANKDQFSFTKSHYNSIINKICLNVVLTSDENKAFQFFDSLNSKGKKLDTINILKSYHLRELKGEELLQKKMATSFDSLNAKVESSNFKNNRIYSLNYFVTLLWVQHNYWTKGNFSIITKNTIETFFRENSIRYIDDIKLIKLFPSIRNMNRTVIDNEESDTNDNSISKETVNFNKFIEFNPLHPVQKGLGFFLSLEKLESYFELLFINPQSEYLKKITELVKTSFNDYFLHFYYVLILGYYIKFEDYRLEEFAFEIEQILGNKFLTLQKVQMNSPIVIMRGEFNILQYIYLNTSPDILIAETVQYKTKVRVRDIKVYKKDGVLKTSVGAIEYGFYTSRPIYIRGALALYSNETDSKHYRTINWKNNKLNKENDRI